jgi:enoyl-CoA hydratase
VGADSDVILEWPQPDVAILKLNRPRQLNALTFPMVTALNCVVDELSSHDKCRVVIVTGEGRGFCAGLDLIDSAGNQEAQTSIPYVYKAQEGFAKIVRSLRSLPQPVIAAVNGAAVGAGFAMVLGCDIRLASPDAAFHVGAVKIGLSAGECGISYHLPRLIGSARAFEIMLTGRPVRAEEAVRIGLVTDLVPADELVGAALHTANTIASNSPFGTAMTKSIMWQNVDADSLDKAIELENRTQTLAFLTQDSREAVRAFAEKRSPVYTGE